MRVFLFALLALGLVGPAYAQVSVDIGIHLPRPPRLVIVPEVRSVQYVPTGDANLFFYSGRYWAFHNGSWHSSRGYNGPWTMVGRNAVPQSVLLVPVNYYRARPANWGQWQRQHPPRWGNEWGHEWAEKRTAPTLLVPTESDVGLLDVHVEGIERWAQDGFQPV